MYVQRGALSDDESSPDPPPQHSSNENEEGATEETGAGMQKLRSSSNTSQISRHTDTNKRRMTDSDGEQQKFGGVGGKDLGYNEYRGPEDMYRLFFVDNHWYLFYRYHHILCERLYKIYKHALQIAEQNNAESKSREQSVAEALKLRNKCK